MNKHDELGALLTVEQVSSMLGLRVSTIRRMILERRIDTVRPSVRAVRIPQSAVQGILEHGYRPAIPPAGKTSERDGYER